MMRWRQRGRRMSPRKYASMIRSNLESATFTCRAARIIRVRNGWWRMFIPGFWGRLGSRKVLTSSQGIDIHRDQGIDAGSDQDNDPGCDQSTFANSNHSLGAKTGTLGTVVGLDAAAILGGRPDFGI